MCIIVDLPLPSSSRFRTLHVYKYSVDSKTAADNAGCSRLVVGNLKCTTTGADSNFSKPLEQFQLLTELVFRAWLADELDHLSVAMAVIECDRFVLVFFNSYLRMAS